MNWRGRQTFLVMTVFFSIVFGPILLFAWKDWREILLLGVRRSPDLAEYVWNALGSAGTPTLLSTSIPGPASPASADLIAPATRKSAIISYTASSTQAPFLSATSDRRLRPSATLTPIPTRTRIPTRTPTRIWTRTPTRIPTRTPTVILPSPTPQPTDTEVPTKTPRPPTQTPRPTRTPRPPTATPRPPTSTDPPPPPTQVPTQPPPPTQVPTTHPPTTYP